MAAEEEASVAGDVSGWIERYGRAWEEADDEGVVALFTEQASYRSHPFREPYIGHDAIRRYWQRGAGRQKTVRVLFGAPIVEAERTAVEWWATLHDPDEGAVTLPGCLILRFAADGRCEELREYWHAASHMRPPPDGWGE